MTSSKVLLTTSIVILLTGCSDQSIQSNWARRSPSIDGSLEEWSSASLVIFEDLQVSLGVGNDSSFVYIAGRVANASLQQMVESSGVVLWLDPDGSHRKDLEIHFPASRAARTNLDRGEFWDSLTEEQKAKAQEKVEEMRRGVLVIDRRSVDSHIYTRGNIEGFEAVIVDSQGLVSFEARIPLQIERYFPKFNRMDPGKMVAVGVGLGASRGDRSRNIDFDSAQPSGEFGFPGRGGPPGNLARGGSPEVAPKEIWLEVILAQPH
jgi:hypothetical protein